MIQKNLEQLVASLISITNHQTRLMMYNTLESLQRDARDNNPKNLASFGFKTYSQNDEDGIINEIFNRIGVTNKLFVEFGVGNGLENNTLSLLIQGWKGLWIDGNTDFVNTIKNNLPGAINTGRLSVINSFIKKDNINDLISSKINDKEIDLLSIDIDGNDYHIFDAIDCISPRVIVIEYNAKFPPPVQYCMNYDNSYSWDGKDSFGASLKFLEVNLKEKDYLLVACNLSGSNAFFVRKDVMSNHFQKPYTAENHYQPPRYYLVGLNTGIPPSYTTIENALSML